MVHSAPANAPVKRAPRALLPKAAVVDCLRRCGINANRARRLQPLDDAAHIVSFGCRGDFPHPRQRREIGFGIDDQQSIQRPKLVRRYLAEQHFV